MGDELVVILNNDNWLTKKKGYALMNEKERAEIIKGLRAVNRVVITNHSLSSTDMSVCSALQKVKPNIFANGGDRTKLNIPEVPLCQKIGCDMVFNVGKGGKVQSSSWILAKFKETSSGKKK